MNIAVTLNSRLNESQKHSEFDPPHTVELIREGIIEAGHHCRVIEADAEAYEKLKRYAPDLVFNRAEGLHGESREAQIPAMLEMLEIPYVGSGVLTLALSLNKGWTKQYLSAAGVTTPRFALLEAHSDLWLEHRWRTRLSALESAFPVILKPNSEGSSIGIGEENLCRDAQSLREKGSAMLESYPGDLLVEQFIEGREISVGVLGTPNGELEVLPLLEVDFRTLPAEVGGVFGHTAKRTYDDLEHYLCPAPVSPALAEGLIDQTLRVCKALEIRDFARLDFRIDPSGTPYFLEINPLPGMDYDLENRDFSFYILMALAAGLDYDALVARLIDSAAARYGLSTPPAGAGGRCGKDAVSV